MAGRPASLWCHRQVWPHIVVRAATGQTLREGAPYRGGELTEGLSRLRVG